MQLSGEGSNNTSVINSKMENSESDDSDSEPLENIKMQSNSDKKVESLFNSIKPDGKYFYMPYVRKFNIMVWVFQDQDQSYLVLYQPIVVHYWTKAIKHNICITNFGSIQSVKIKMYLLFCNCKDKF